jgi:hypothetical protein
MRISGATQFGFRKKETDVRDEICVSVAAVLDSILSYGRNAALGNKFPEAYLSYGDSWWFSGIPLC